MKVTVCELHDDPAALAQDWEALCAHVQAEASDLVLLPEMPFTPWLPAVPRPDPQAWAEAVAAHDHWLARLDELAPAWVIGTRPVLENGRRRNEGFARQPGGPLHAVHTKYYLPDDDGFWEASWYERGEKSFTPVFMEWSGERSGSLVGFGLLICTELWFLEHARAYGQAGVHLIANPRATHRDTVEKWLVGGRAAAVVSGAYSLSSNHAPNRTGPEPVFGGQGWVIDPDGEVLGLTSPDRPFLTVEIDLQRAEAAKTTYPRYVQE